MAAVRLLVVIGLAFVGGCSVFQDYDAIRPMDASGDAGGDAGATDSWSLVPRWLRSIGSPAADEARACAIDASGNVYVVGLARDGAVADDLGSMTNAGLTDAFIATYDSNGGGMGVEVFGSPSLDGIRDIAVVGDTMYLAGYFTGPIDFGGGEVVSTGQDAFLLSRSLAGALNWLTVGEGTGPAMARGIDAKNGRVYATGSYGRDQPGPYELRFQGCNFRSSQEDSTAGWIAALDDVADGNCLWMEDLESVGSDQVSRAVISPSVLAPVIVGGRTDGLPLEAPANHDLWFAEMTPQGVTTWSRNPPGPAGFEEAVDVLATSADACALGRFESEIEFDDGQSVDPGTGQDGFVTCRLLTSGDHHWTSTFASSLTVRLDGGAVIGQTFVVAGAFDGTMELESPQLVAQGVRDGLVLALDSATGQVRTAAAFGGTGAVVIHDVAARDDTLCVAGVYDRDLAVGDDQRSSVSDSNDAFVAVFDLVHELPD